MQTLPKRRFATFSETYKCTVLQLDAAAYRTSVLQPQCNVMKCRFGSERRVFIKHSSLQKSDIITGIISSVLTFIPSHPPFSICRSHLISAFTEATTLFSRQSTLEDLDGMPECIPKTSERARPKLRKMYGLDVTNSSMDSGSSFMSRCPAGCCITHVHLHVT